MPRLAWQLNFEWCAYSWADKDARDIRDWAAESCSLQPFHAHDEPASEEVYQFDCRVRDTSRSASKSPGGGLRQAVCFDCWASPTASPSWKTVRDSVDGNADVVHWEQQLTTLVPTHGMTAWISAVVS